MKRLTVLAVVIATATLIPLIYIAVRAFGARGDVWSRLWEGQIPSLLSNTISLTNTVIILTVLLGVMCAWLVERTDMPGRMVWRWVLALPLAIPAYVAAACWLIVWRRGGLLEQAYMNFTGVTQGQLWLPNLYTLSGASIVISLCVFPYVYLPATAALRSINRSLEEAARMAGRGPWGTFRDITLPLILPAVTAGALLVALYTLSDFGTVALMQYRTFTVAIYKQFVGQIDRSAAAILSFVLVGLTVPLLFIENRLSGRARRQVTNTAWKPRDVLRLGRWRWLALAGVGLVALLSLGLPLGILSGLTLQGAIFPTEVDRIWSVGGESVWQYGLNSGWLAALAATFATVLAFVPTYLAARFPRSWTQILLGLCKTPYALPGLIVGLGFVMVLNQWLPLIYGTVLALIIGFSFRLMPQAIATGEAALRAVPPSLEQAARSMGRRSFQAFREITLPIAAPGVLASWTLTFITAMKELPTALLLRPPGFDTLPVRIWSAATESVYTQAAPPALLLVFLTMLPMAIIYSSNRFGVERTLHD